MTKSTELLRGPEGPHYPKPLQILLRQPIDAIQRLLKILDRIGDTEPQIAQWYVWCLPAACCFPRHRWCAVSVQSRLLNGRVRRQAGNCRPAQSEPPALRCRSEEHTSE